MRLRRSLFLLYALFALGPPALFAQAQRQGTITSTECVPIDVTAQSTVGIQVTGTWTGTLQPKISIQGQSPQNVQVTPSTSSTAQSTITANGIYRASVAAGTTFLLCGNTVGSGTANVYLNSSTANLSARDAVGGTIDPGTVNLLAKYSGTTSVGPSGVTDDGTTVSAPEILQFGNIPCASLDSNTTAITSCSAARNYFLAASAGSTAANFNRAFNLYYQTDGHNAADSFGQQIASTWLVDAGSLNTNTHYGLDVYGAVSGNAVSGMEMRIINARPRVVNGAHLNKLVYYHGTTAAVVCSTCIVDTAYGVDLGLGVTGGGTVTDSVGYSMNMQNFKYGAMFGGLTQPLMLEDTLNGAAASGACHASMGVSTFPISAIHDCYLSTTATPEGALAANVGSLSARRDGSYGSSLYVKENGTGNTGWGRLLTSNGSLGPNAGPALATARIDTIINQQLTTGDVVLYTVPSGKRATIALIGYNSSVGTIVNQLKFKTGGTTYNLGASSSMSTNTSSQIAVVWNTFPLGESGDQFIINTDVAGLNLTGYVISYDNTEALKSPKVVSDGSSTTYTVYNAGAHQGYMLNMDGSNSPFRFYNASGGTRTYNIYVVPNGGSVGSTTKAAPQFTVTNNNSSTQATTTYGFANNDSLQITTDAGTAGQLIVMQNLVEQ